MKEIKTVKDLIKNEDLTKNIVEDLEDFEPDAKVSFEVWAIGYDTNNNITDTEMLIGSHTLPDPAIDHAKKLTLSDIIHQAAEEDDGSEPTADIAYVSVEVETVIDDDEEGSMNVGTIYRRELWIDGEYGTEENVPR